ncbi:dihydrofolate reductase family protein [Pseudarthrobacter sp. J1738]|uniref:dihydrofolate reductase family protein n=1 Tax=Pseudarthrobacter sp. J1738 TaxID=3420446 RepID=UPI003D2D9AB9
MADFVYYVATSLDGFIATDDDSLDWLMQFDSPELNQSISTFMASVGSIVMGASTFQWLREHDDGTWPYAGTPCWVFTHHEFSAPPGADVTFVRGPVAEFVPDLAAEAGDKNVWLMGGGDIVAQFAQAGALNKIIQTVVPVALGSGRRMLPLVTPTPVLALDSSRTVGGGAVEMCFSFPDTPAES